MPLEKRYATGDSTPRSLLGAVIAYSLMVNAVSLLGSCLWSAPDTSYYVELAGGIAERSDFRSQLYLIRPPGYPLMLAGIFTLFGGASATAILVVQHAMMVAIAAIICDAAWRMTESRTAALVAGLAAASSLQILAYANLLLTEAPYALLLVASVYALIRFSLNGGLRWLILSSALAGLSYLVRPIGMTLVGACGLAAILRCHRPVLPMNVEPKWPPVQARLAHAFSWRGLCGMACAVVPAFLIASPAMIQNKLIHGGDLSSRCADLALYHRVAYMDKLDSDKSAAFNEIKATVAAAIERGHLPPGSDHRTWGQVWKAYESVRGIDLTAASAVMGRAARDLIREQPWRTAELSAKYAYWMLMVPDSFYRFHPGGAPGVVNADGESVRDASAEIFDARTYEPTMRRWTGPYERYLHLQAGATAGPITPLWTAVNRWFYRSVEARRAIAFFDSPYEAMMCACLLCFVPCIVAGRGRQRGQTRTAWLLIAAVVTLQIGVSAILAGPTPRYAAPVQPLLVLAPAAVVAMMVSAVIAAAMRVRGKSSQISEGPSRSRAWAQATG